MLRCRTFSHMVMVWRIKYCWFYCSCTKSDIIARSHLSDAIYYKLHLHQNISVVSLSASTLINISFDLHHICHVINTYVAFIGQYWLISRLHCTCIDHASPDGWAVWGVVVSTRWWWHFDHCVLRNWDWILVRAVKGLISRAGMVSICPLLWQRDVKLQQTNQHG